jgi:hypothetical protein
MSRFVPTALVLLSLLLGPGIAAAQEPTDSIRAAALRDYHGPDLHGKDGPLAKAGLDLLVLYHEYRAVQATGVDTTFTPRQDLRLKNGRVGIEAVATDTAEELLADLKALGLKDGVTAGRLVSGWLPVEQIPAMARLESLRGLIQSKMQTRTPSSQPAPSRLSPPDPPSPPSPDTSGAQPEPGTGASSDDEADDAGLFVLLLGGFLLAVES